MAINMQSLQSLLTQFSESFYSDDFQELFIIEKLISELTDKSPELLALALLNPELQKFKEDSYYYELSLSHLRNQGWDLVSEANDIKVESHYSGADFYTRASVLINSSIFETLSVISEIDLLSSW